MQICLSYFLKKIPFNPLIKLRMNSPEFIRSAVYF